MESTAISKQIGQNLARARKAMGLTQKELAKEMKKYQPDYSEYETGKIQLNYEQILFLCSRLKISPNKLFELGK